MYKKVITFLLAIAMIVGLASCGGDQTTEKTEETTATLHETPTANTKEEVKEADYSYLTDNSTQERIDRVINEGNGWVYNKLLDNDGTVRWIYDNMENPRLTKQVSDFIATGATLDELSEFVLELGISPNPYVANLESGGSPDVGINPDAPDADGPSDPYSEVSWYDDVISRVNESYNNRGSNEQVVFTQNPWSGEIIAEQRTTYDTMEPVPVTFNEDYMLAPGWYWYLDEVTGPYRQLKWFQIGPQDEYYASKQYLYARGISISLTELAYTTFSLDHPTADTILLDESREGYTYLGAYAQIEDSTITIWCFDIYDMDAEAGTFMYEWNMPDVPISEFHYYSEYTNDYTDRELYEITFNEIVPNL